MSNLIPHLQRLLLIVLSIISQSSDRRTHCTITYPSEYYQETLYLHNHAASTLPHKTRTPLPAVRSLLKTASQAQSLSALFFATRLGKTNNVKVFRSFEVFSSNESLQTHTLGPDVIQWDRPMFEEASWVEEQRFLRALWRAVIYFDTLAGLEIPNTELDCTTSEILLRAGPRGL